MRQTLIAIMLAVGLTLSFHAFRVWAFNVSWERGSFGLLLDYCVFLCFSILAIGGIIVAAFKWALATAPLTQRILSSLILGAGILIGWYLPFPMLIEQQHFQAYRAEYEEVIERLHAGELEQITEIDVTREIYGLPQELWGALPERIDVYHTDRGLVVRFAADIRHPDARRTQIFIFYIEGTISVLNRFECNPTMALDVHWYLCYRGD